MKRAAKESAARTVICCDIHWFGDQFGYVYEIALIKVAWIFNVHVVFHDHIWPIEVYTVPPVQYDKKP